MKRRSTVVTLAIAAAFALAGCAPAAAPSDAPFGAPSTATGPFAFTAQTLDGDTIDGTTLMGKDVVLWFWAPWCPICLVEGKQSVAPALAEFPDDVEFIGVMGLATSQEEIDEFLEWTGTGDATHIIDADGSIWAGFGVALQPALYFVNQDGTARRFGSGMSTEDILAEVAILTSK